VDQLPAIVCDEEKHVRFDTRRSGPLGARQPRCLGARWPGTCARSGCRLVPASASDGADRSPDDNDAQLEKLPTDPLTAPEAIVPGHGGDEGADFSAQTRPSEPSSRLPRPIQPPNLAVPAEDGFGLDDVQAPRRPSLSEPHPEQTIRVGQTGRGIGAKDNQKLMTEN
jgi:hypothetical protein